MDAKSDLINRARNMLEAYDIGYYVHQVWSREYLESIDTLDAARLEQLQQLISDSMRRSIDVYRAPISKDPKIIASNQAMVRSYERSLANWMNAIEKGFQLVNEALQRRADEREHELVVKKAEYAHLERIKELELEIERAKLDVAKAQTSAEYGDKAAEREHVFRLEELKVKFEEEMVRLTQPHDLKKQQAEMLKELVRYQTELAEKADKTDAEKEIDSIVASIVKMFEMARAVPTPTDSHGNVDDFAADAQYQMIVQIAGELIKARLAGAKKDLAG